MPRRQEYEHIYQIRFSLEQWVNLVAELADRKTAEPQLTIAAIIRERVEECTWTAETRKEQLTA